MIAQAAECLRLSDFDFDLPGSLIAQEPRPQRDRSRLMMLGRRTGSLSHCIFADLERLLLPGDTLILNDTRVYPCRLVATKPGGGKAEIFLLEEKGNNVWEALVKGCAGTVKRLTLTPEIEAELSGPSSDAVRTVRFHGVGDIRTVLGDIGKVPLPPYIKRDPTDADRERYQTIYASHDGAVAAPTAGLHFTRELLSKLESKGIELVTITLHVGPGTFQPVRAEKIAEHRMLPERYRISERAAARINEAKRQNRRVIAVGTTSVRTLETVADAGGCIVPGEGSSSLFIHPGYQFKAVDGMITNFHLPKSTLLMLTAAFAGRERVLSAYRAAVTEQYRFYSYGDAMLIL